MPGTDTVPGTDGTLDVQVPSERITGVVPKNRLEVFFQNLTCVAFASSGAGSGSLGI